jgi:hypothetical protein
MQLSSCGFISSMVVITPFTIFIPEMDRSIQALAGLDLPDADAPVQDAVELEKIRGLRPFAIGPDWRSPGAGGLPTCVR